MFHKFLLLVMGGLPNDDKAPFFSLIPAISNPRVFRLGTRIEFYVLLTWTGGQIPIARQSHN